MVNIFMFPIGYIEIILSLSLGSVWNLEITKEKNREEKWKVRKFGGK